MGLWDYGIMGLWGYGIMGLWDYGILALRREGIRALSLVWFLLEILDTRIYTPLYNP